MTGAERQARYSARKTAAYLAEHPIPDWLKGAPTLAELTAGIPSLEDALADITDPILRAECMAEAAAAEAPQEAEAEGVDQGEDDEDGL